MTIRLVAIDLDGTLLTGAKQLPPRGSQRIKQAWDQGIHIIISTTRNYDYVQKICAALAIDDPVICSNGAIIYSGMDGKLWRKHSIPIEIAKQICRMADENDWELVTSVENTTYYKQRPGQALGRLAENIEVVKTNQEAMVGPPHRILVWQMAAIQKLEAVCQENFSGACHIEMFYKPDSKLELMGIFACGADKGSALKFVLEKLSIDPNKMMAIGDNANDLAMFGTSGVSVAMGNAPLDIQQAANFVAPSNEDEGVAWALENLVL